jgi:hypothetical protein
MASLKMTKPGDDKAPSTGTATCELTLARFERFGTGDVDRRGSTSYRRASRVEADGGSFTQGAFHRRLGRPPTQCCVAETLVCEGRRTMKRRRMPRRRIWRRT